VFIEYRPDLLPELTAVFTRFAGHTRGLDGFRELSHWEAVFALPDIDPRRDILIIAKDTRDSEKEIQGFAWLYTKPAPDFVYLRGPYVDPDVSDLEMILNSVIDRSVLRAGESGSGYIEGRSLFPSWEAAYINAGFIRMGAYQRCRLFPVIGAIPVSEIPTGSEIRTWGDFRDISILMELFTSAFKDHWDYQPPKIKEWEEIIKGKLFDPAMHLTAFEGKKAVGYIFGQAMPDYSNRAVRMAYLVSIGVHPDHQGAGWGRALLTRWLRGVYESGARAVELDVDAENSGALALYKSLGLRFIRQEDVYRKYLR
jgi:ribosomal protein S18 acetylase RimI-like enzyme